MHVSANVWVILGIRNPFSHDETPPGQIPGTAYLRATYCDVVAQELWPQRWQGAGSNQNEGTAFVTPSVLVEEIQLYSLFAND